VKTSLNNLYHKDVDNNIWRLMVYKDGSFTYNSTTDQQVAYECGKALSIFFIKLEN
jgi:hypothetical protein